VMVGWVQIARGAHFFSHVLASAWVAWGLSWLGAGGFYRKRAK
jgi:membrane-associated PAP2 superfamily phosphatase